MPKRNLAWMLLIVVIALILWQLPPVIAARDTIIRNFGQLAEIRQIIQQRAVWQPDDARIVRASVRAGAQAMVASLQDPYARYLDPEEYRKFKDLSEGLIGGVGVDVAVIDGELIVQSVSPDTPAAQAGIQPRDEILEIDGDPVDRIDPIEAVNLLAGEPGSHVRLTVRTPMHPSRELSLSRAAVQLNPVRGWSRRPDGNWRYMIDRASGVGYVRLTEFLPNSVSAVDAAVAAMQQEGARGWIFDLRENRGGILEVAIELADRFLADGVIVSTRGPTSDRREWRAERDGTYAPQPMVVLVNGWSASCAEVLSGALRDNHRAVLVGERTYGKGSVQELLPLKDGSAIKLTTRYYYLPGGTCIQKRPGADDWGVRPDLVVPLSDPQRQRWLRHWLTGVWSDVGPAATTRAATQPPDDESPQRTAMFAIDPQLRQAWLLLRRELHSAEPSTRPAATRTDGSPS